MFICVYIYTYIYVYIYSRVCMYCMWTDSNRLTRNASGVHWRNVYIAYTVYIRYTVYIVYTAYIAYAAFIVYNAYPLYIVAIPVCF